ncbi:hypothetical protein [Maribacter litoralis]|uniref:hypothetical protein n=1 Tax=Maribacter litoralis TaxID=2059726 RepID=UPI003F5CC787
MSKTNRVKNLFLLLLCFSLVISCKTEDDLFVEKLDGGYTISEMTYKGESVMGSVMAAMLSFDNQDELLFKPPIIKDEIGKYEKYKWDFSKDKKDKYLLNFDSNHRYFNGAFDISFEVDSKNKQLKIILESEDTYINCTRLYIFENFNELKDNW